MSKKTWTADENTSLKLLIAVIKTSQPKIDCAAVAAFMGPGRTAYAVQHQIRKLQAIAGKATGNDTDTNVNHNTATQTPVKNGASKKRKKIDVEPNEGAEDDRMLNYDGSTDGIGADADAAPKRRKVKTESGNDEEV